MAKVTKREQFVEILAIVGEDTEQGVFVKNEIALIDKRKGAKRVSTKEQIKNLAVKEDIVAVLEANGALRAGEIGNILDLGVQKITALVGQLVKDGEVVREVEGKVTRFAVAAE